MKKHRQISHDIQMKFFTILDKMVGLSFTVNLETRVQPTFLIYIIHLSQNEQT